MRTEISHKPSLWCERSSSRAIDSGIHKSLSTSSLQERIGDLGVKSAVYVALEGVELMPIGELREKLASCQDSGDRPSPKIDDLPDPIDDLRG